MDTTCEVIQLFCHRSNNLESEAAENSPPTVACDISRSSVSSDINNNPDSLDKRVRNKTIPELSETISYLRNYDKQTKDKVFSNSYVDCGICFDSRLGSNCIKYWPCDHAYCKDCIRQHFIVNIKDGRVKQLSCPYSKCSSEANPKQVCWEDFCHKRHR